MTYRILTKHRGKFLAIATALWSADSITVLGASLQPGCSNDPKSCTLMGCRAAVSMHIPATSWLSNGKSPTISVCRGTKCISGSLEVSDGGSLIRDGTFASFPRAAGADSAEVTVTPTIGSSARVDISYFPLSEDDLTDGDHYTVTLSNDNGAPLIYEQTVTYTIIYPNGPECGPGCKNAEVTLSEVGT